MTNKPNNTKYFYQMSAEEAVDVLKTDDKKGLSESEAQKRLQQYGRNKLVAGKKSPLFFKFLNQFKDLMIIVLIIAGFLAYYLDDFMGGTILLAIVMINAVIGFYQEFKAEKILESLKKIIETKATVIRDGHKKEIPQEELVPGDLVFLDEGCAIPADLRITESVSFSTNDFVLTGESVPQEKFAKLIIEKETTLTNQDNLVFLGVTVAKGNAYGVVYGTGMNTAIGRIATTSEAIERDLSPLQREMNIVAKTLTKIAGFIALALFGINLLLTMGSAGNLKSAFEVSILFALGVAAACVPQGLPAQVSVALSLGVGRMAKRNAVVRKLSAVEALGSTMVICSDKTGTLTKNEMTITNCYVNGKEYEVSGIGYEPKGAIMKGDKKMTKSELDDLQQFFEDGFLSSNGRVNPPDSAHKGWYSIGDPTESAFTPLAIKAGLDPNEMEKRFPIFQEIPFDSDRKRMTILRKHKGKLIGYMKGGLESVLSVCSHINNSGEVKVISEKERKEIIKAEKKFAEQALRVIALAYKDFPAIKKTTKLSPDNTEKDFVFAGFVAMIDPPRVGVKEAVKAAYDAHIRIMMITGDNEITAQAIAERIGMKLDNKDFKVYSGDDIKKIGDKKMKDILKNRTVIFSRVSPQDKYRIVTLLKEMGDIVAVTGDGVNDTLSLKKADIGVSMGKMGSEVAKEASEIVLLDDNFRTLIAAIKEGRTIFKNLRKTILANIAANNAELTTVLIGFVGMAFGLPIPITAVQILAVDLIGEIMPLAALTFDPAEKEILKEPPRNLNDHVINFKSLLSVIFYGFWMGTAAYFSFYMVHKVGGAPVEVGRAAAYLSIILCQYVNILCHRTEKTVFTRYLFSNPQLWGALLISFILVLTLIYQKNISYWFGFNGLSLSQWSYPAIGALFILFWHEIRKVFLKTKELR